MGLFLTLLPTGLAQALMTGCCIQHQQQPILAQGLHQADAVLAKKGEIWYDSNHRVRQAIRHRPPRSRIAREDPEAPGQDGDSAVNPGGSAELEPLFTPNSKMNGWPEGKVTTTLKPTLGWPCKTQNHQADPEISRHTSCSGTDMRSFA